MNFFGRYKIPLIITVLSAGFLAWVTIRLTGLSENSDEITLMREILLAAFSFFVIPILNIAVWIVNAVRNTRRERREIQYKDDYRGYNFDYDETGFEYAETGDKNDIDTE